MISTIRERGGGEQDQLWERPRGPLSGSAEEGGIWPGDPGGRGAHPHPEPCSSRAPESVCVGRAGPQVCCALALDTFARGGGGRGLPLASVACLNRQNKRSASSGGAPSPWGRLRCDLGLLSPGRAHRTGRYVTQRSSILQEGPKSLEREGLGLATLVAFYQVQGPWLRVL